MNLVYNSQLKWKGECTVIKKILIAFALIGMFSKAEALYLDFEGRVAYVAPTAKSGKRLYSGAPLSYQLEASMHFAYFWRDIPWKVWINTSWLPATGHFRRNQRHHNLLHLHSDGEFSLPDPPIPAFEPKAETNWIPSSLGLKYSWDLCGFGSFYLGLGGSFSYYRIRLRNDFFERKIIKKQLGYVFKSGWSFAVCNWIIFDFFADYYINSFAVSRRHHEFFELNTSDIGRFEPFKKGHRRLNLNCFMTGGGIGIIF